MVDFGMMGTVTAPVRAVLVEILLALATKDSMRSAVALRGVGIVPNDGDEVRFAAELDRLTSASYDLPAGEMRLAPLACRRLLAGERVEVLAAELDVAAASDDAAREAAGDEGDVVEA
jgi:hypothetical protein